MPERPRDRLGRPLAADADPADAAPAVPDVAGLDDFDVWSLAMDYLEQDLPFHAHEVFEQRWRHTEEPDRTVWRALAQWGAALTHAARGNSEGARRLARRAVETLGSAPPVILGVDTARMQTSCRELAGEAGISP